MHKELIDHNSKKIYNLHLSTGHSGYSESAKGICLLTGMQGALTRRVKK
ncbi:hypothetical protein [Rubinisphaera sp.]|nr:hypothetical protein [Rubinisphaera sp.]